MLLKHFDSCAASLTLPITGPGPVLAAYPIQHTLMLSWFLRLAPEIFIQHGGGKPHVWNSQMNGRCRARVLICANISRIRLLLCLSEICGRRRTWLFSPHRIRTLTGLQLCIRTGMNRNRRTWLSSGHTRAEPRPTRVLAMTLPCAPTTTTCITHRAGCEAQDNAIKWFLPAPLSVCLVSVSPFFKR